MSRSERAARDYLRKRTALRREQGSQVDRAGDKAEAEQYEVPQGAWLLNQVGRSCRFPWDRLAALTYGLARRQCFILVATLWRSGQAATAAASAALLGQRCGRRSAGGPLAVRSPGHQAGDVQFGGLLDMQSIAVATLAGAPAGSAGSWASSPLGDGPTRPIQAAGCHACSSSSRRREPGPAVVGAAWRHRQRQ